MTHLRKMMLKELGRRNYAQQQSRGGTKRSVTVAKSAEVAKIEGKPVRGG